jgi:hypothetical protein
MESADRPAASPRDQVPAARPSGQGYRPLHVPRHGAEVIQTLRRGRDDVFLIGEEQLLTDQDAADPDLTFTTGPQGGRSIRRTARSYRIPSSLHGARGLALAGLATGLAAILAALELGGGGGPTHRTRTSSPRSPLISRSAARVPADPTTRVHPRAARAVEVHRPSVVHHRPRRPDRREPSRPTTTAVEPEREPTIQVAPVSSSAVVPTAPTPAPSEGPTAAPKSTPPVPPPSSSGGGPAGVESFGFER